MEVLLVTASAPFRRRARVGSCGHHQHRIQATRPSRHRPTWFCCGCRPCHACRPDIGLVQRLINAKVKRKEDNFYLHKARIVIVVALGLLSL